MLHRLLPLLLVAAGLRADGLADLRAALARLRPQEACKARVTLSLFRRFKDGDKPRQGQASLELEAESGPGGLRLSFRPRA